MKMRWSKDKQRRLAEELRDQLLSELRDYKPDDYTQLTNSDELETFLDDQVDSMIQAIRSHVNHEKMTLSEALSNELVSFLPNGYCDGKISDLDSMIASVFSTWEARIASDRKLNTDMLTTLRNEVIDYASQFYVERIRENDLYSIVGFEVFVVFFIDLKMQIEDHSKLIRSPLLRVAESNAIAFSKAFEHFRKMPESIKSQTVDFFDLETHDSNLFLANFFIAEGMIKQIDSVSGGPAARIGGEDKLSAAYKDLLRNLVVDQNHIPGSHRYLMKTFSDEEERSTIATKNEALGKERPRKWSKLESIEREEVKGLIEENRHKGKKRKGAVNLSAVARKIHENYPLSCTHETVYERIKDLGLLEFAKLSTSK